MPSFWEQIRPWECMACGKQNISANRTHCPKCQTPRGGTVIAEVIEVVQAPEPMAACPTCHASVASDAKFCPQCGSPIGRKEEVVSAPPPQREGKPQKVDAAQALADRINAIIAPVIDSRTDKVIDRPLEDDRAVKLFVAELTMIQKQLRALKADINLMRKEVRAGFTQKLAHVSTHPIVGLLAGKKQAAHVSMHDKARLKKQQDDAIRPYNNAIHFIDQYILMFDQVKLRIQQQST
jgi:hypothetical protein